MSLFNTYVYYNNDNIIYINTVLFVHESINLTLLCVSVTVRFADLLEGIVGVGEGDSLRQWSLSTEASRAVHVTGDGPACSTCEHVMDNHNTNRITYVKCMYVYTVCE